MKEFSKEITYKELEDLERQRKVAECLRGTLAVLNSELSVDKLLTYIISQAIPILQADGAAIYRLQMNGVLTIEALVGLPVEYIKYANIPLGKLLTGKSTLTKKPVFINDLKTLKKEPNLSDELMRAMDELAKKYRSALSVPIDIRDESYGSLTFYFMNKHTIDEEEIALAKDFSIQVALAIDNARLRVRSQQDAVAQERNRLARELHDSVTQNLFSASLIAESLPTIMNRNPERGQEGLSELHMLTKGALAEMRTLLLELRPHAIEESRLEDLLRQLSETAESRLRKPVSFTNSGQALLPTEVRLTFYRITQEALNNIFKHAQANSITISLDCSTEVIDGVCEQASLTIIDDGCGFETKNWSSNHLGFEIMKERAQSINAQLTISSHKNCGTTIHLTWVLPEQRKK